MIKLNDESIYVGQIKQILSSFNLPRCKVSKASDSYDDEIHISGDSVYLGSKRILPYKFGDRLDNVTDNLVIDSMIYDEGTHVYLGDYLRFLRDYTGLDLMGMYNCFSYFVPNISDYSYKDGDYVLFSISSADSKHNVFSMPVKFGKKYWLHMDWHGEVQTMVGFHSFGSKVDAVYGTVNRMSGLKFDEPICIEIPERTASNWRRERELRLFLKVAKSCTSEIVVIESNEKPAQLIIDGYEKRLGGAFIEYIPEGSDEAVGNYDYVTKSQLLDVNSQNKTLLADRLVEYLSKNVIDVNDEISKNIKRLQLTLISKGDYAMGKDSYFGIWDNGLRESIYRKLWSTNEINKHFDLLSYCDKDAESMLGGLDDLMSVNSDKEAKILYE